MIVLLPSRGRPKGASAAIASFYDTVSLIDTKIVLILNRDDPELGEYYKLNEDYITLPDHYNTLTKKLNYGADILSKESNILGFIADDNRFRTSSWDAYITQALSKPGLAYGNDLYQGQGLPTSVFISTEIYKALGWFALPTSDHMYLDNAWKTLGERLGRLVYLPDVVIEHLHPVVGKGEWDETYMLSNTNERLTKDREAFENWAINEIDYDIQRINEAVK